MRDRREQAASIFSQGFNCAQAVFSAYAPLQGLEEATALRIAGGLGAGMGRLQEVCGAVTGAILLIGLKYGKVQPDDNAARERTYQKVRELVDQFRRIHGSINCRELLGCNLNTEEGQRYAREHNLFDLRCEQYVRDAATLVEPLLSGE